MEVPAVPVVILVAAVSVPACRPPAKLIPTATTELGTAPVHTEPSPKPIPHGVSHPQIFNVGLSTASNRKSGGIEIAFRSSLELAVGEQLTLMAVDAPGLPPLVGHTAHFEADEETEGCYASEGVAGWVTVATVTEPSWLARGSELGRIATVYPRIDGATAVDDDDVNSSGLPSDVATADVSLAIDADRDGISDALVIDTCEDGVPPHGCELWATELRVRQRDGWKSLMWWYSG